MTKQNKQGSWPAKWQVLLDAFRAGQMQCGARVSSPPMPGRRANLFLLLLLWIVGFDLICYSKLKGLF